MPCIKCSNGKWRLGSGKCMYTSLAKCKKAEAAYHANKNKEQKENDTERKSRDSN
jgi:hypothetical protein